MRKSDFPTIRLSEYLNVRKSFALFNKKIVSLHSVSNRTEGEKTTLYITRKFK